MKNSEEMTTLSVSKKLMGQFREIVVNKYGTYMGRLRREGENAIRNHIKTLRAEIDAQEKSIGGSVPNATPKRTRSPNRRQIPLAQE